MGRKKKTTLDSSPAPKATSKGSNEVSFIAFFQDCLFKEQVKSWEEKELYLFFKRLGLREKEPSDTYKDAFKKF